jgi:hypothetical protein
VLLEHCKELDADFAEIDVEDFDLLNYYAVSGRYSDDLMAGMDEIKSFENTAKQLQVMISQKLT